MRMKDEIFARFHPYIVRLTIRVLAWYDSKPDDLGARLGISSMSIIYSCFVVFFIALSIFSFPKTTATFEADSQRSAKLLYRQQCSKCHGMDGRAQSSKGKFSHARDLTDPKWQDDVTDERIFNSIMNGRNVRGNMPKFADRLSEAEVNGIVTLVRDLRSK